MNSPAEMVISKRTLNRTIVSALSGEETSDGAGVRIRRFIGTAAMNTHDPFLLFDAFHSDDAQDYIHGFPEHPHRGFDTVTYLFHGRIRHRDNRGHQGVIDAGGVQWMRAGRGIIHSEMPEQHDGLLSGIQLWINLPKAQKMDDPSYREFSASQIPHEQLGLASRIHVVAGRTARDTLGPVQDIPTNPLFLDVELAPGEIFNESLPEYHAAFVYVHQGRIQVEGAESSFSDSLDSTTLATLSHGSKIRIKTDQRSRFLLVAAKVLNEPIARGGPFVMNTRDEIRQAFSDYEKGKF